MDYIRTEQARLRTRLHVHAAFTFKMLMQSQIQTRVSYSLCPLGARSTAEAEILASIL